MILCMIYLQRLLCDTYNKCITTNVRAKLISQDNSGQKIRIFFSINSQFQDFTHYRSEFFLFFHTLQDQWEHCHMNMPQIASSPNH